MNKPQLSAEMNETMSAYMMKCPHCQTIIDLPQEKETPMQNKPQLSAEMRKHCMCERCKDGVIHAACCAVHNMPAEPNGECDCEPETPAFSEDLSYYWQRILGEDWTNNQPLYELYLWVVKELATALEEQRKEILSEVLEMVKHQRLSPKDGYLTDERKRHQNSLRAELRAKLN